MKHAAPLAIAVVTLAAAAAPVRGAAPPPTTLRAGMAACAAVGDALQRLECYDRLARRFRIAAPGSASAPAPAAPPATVRASPPRPAPAATTAAPAHTGAWRTHVERNDRGKIVAVTLRLRADRQSGGVGNRAELVLRCRDGETGVVINWENYAGDGSVPVTLSRDGGTSARRPWPVTADGSRTRYPGDAAAFIRSLLRTDALTARLDPYGGYPITAKFRPDGLAVAVKPLRRACGR